MGFGILDNWCRDLLRSKLRVHVLGSEHFFDEGCQRLAKSLRLRPGGAAWESFRLTKLSRTRPPLPNAQALRHLIAATGISCFFLCMRAAGQDTPQEEKTNEPSDQKALVWSTVRDCSVQHQGEEQRLR